jgi:hypothetical protein
MHSTAAFLAIFAGAFASIVMALCLPLIAFSKAEQEKSRARRMADAKMNARLLRFDI